MNALLKKEIRLLLPSWIVAMLLALPSAYPRSVDGIPVVLLFIGLMMMALSSFGRETSLNTFSSLLAQPVERTRIWRTKLSVLVVAFLTVFGVWHLAVGFFFHDYSWNVADYTEKDSSGILICGYVGAISIFAGGLWSTLLLRQIAAAFWLTLLTPIVLVALTGVTAAILPASYSDHVVIAVLCVICAMYSVCGFLFARWLFFRAQDIGWSGGIISLPEWRWFSARSETATSTRSRTPMFALLKKEFQLQQVGLTGAAGLLGLHIGVIVLRKYHEFAKDSLGQFLTFIFWVLWLVMAPIVGSMAVAEERRLGVMEGQLCLPVSRRVQFAIKCFLTLLLGTFLAGVLPMLLEDLAIGFGSQNPMFTPGAHTEWDVGVFWFQLAIVAFAAGLVFVSFFASTLARSFLQAIGLAVATVGGFVLIGTGMANANAKSFFGIVSLYHWRLTVVLAVPTMIVTLLWLGYLNFKNSQSGWPLWRRNLTGLTGAVLFIIVGSAMIYNRAWEVFEPAEPPHGTPKFSLSNPPTVQDDASVGWRGSLLVRLPDGRVWYDRLGYPFLYESEHSRWKVLWWVLVRPLPTSAGPRQFIAGSNWVSVTAPRHVDFRAPAEGIPGHVVGYLDTVGIQPDGTLWISGEAKPIIWTGARMIRFGDETNWQQVVPLDPGFLLLKKDGTLWQWGTNRWDWSQWQTNWPSVRASKPQQVGTNSDWTGVFSHRTGYARKTDGSIWMVHVDLKTGKDELERRANLDQFVPQTFSRASDNSMALAYVGKDGTLWVYDRYFSDSKERWEGTARFVQVGKETNWVAVAVNLESRVALKADGSLWKWIVVQVSASEVAKIPPTRLGIHSDWVALTGTRFGAVSLAADGSLWFWPDAGYYDGVLLKTPKQPQLLGNIFSDTH
jgi:hypothetical protein